jgi:hypothetical protein
MANCLRSQTELMNDHQYKYNYYSISQTNHQKIRH